MKQCYYYFLICMTLCVFQSTFGQRERQKPIVVLDPGHGGPDSGAVGINGLKEKEVVLKIAMEVVRLNKQLFQDTFEIYSTRYTDTLISLGNRTKLARALKADVFVSIHCNQAIRKEAQGAEIYIKQGNNRSELLARLFVSSWSEKLGFKNRGVKSANFQVLREVSHCPAVLLELCFLSNWEEAEHIKKMASISGYALSILEALTKFSDYD